MTEQAPNSATPRKPSVKPRIGTPDHLLNSDTVIAVNPFASHEVKESISFDKALCEFLRLHFHVHEAKAREWMSTADAKDSEALRFSKAVHQAENAHWNQLGQFRGHFAVWHADPLYMRAYEAWPDLTMHERYSRLKMALGPVSTPFNFAGTLEDAQAALDKFILTGEIPKPAPPSPALVAACKNDEISRRSAALEKAFEKPAVVHGPVKVAAQKIEAGETVVKLTDETFDEANARMRQEKYEEAVSDDDDDLDDWFPRDDPKVNADGIPDKPGPNKHSTYDPEKMIYAIPNYLIRELGLSTDMRSDVLGKHIRECFGGPLEISKIKQGPEWAWTCAEQYVKRINQEKDKVTQIADKPAETTAAATAVPPKPNDAPAGKAEPQATQNLVALPEAPFSANFHLFDTHGINIQFTVRSDSVNDGMKRVKVTIEAALKDGYTADKPGYAPMQTAVTGGSSAPALPMTNVTPQIAANAVPAAPNGAGPDNKGRIPGQTGADRILAIQKQKANGKETIELWGTGQYAEHFLRLPNEWAMLTNMGINVAGMEIGTKCPVNLTAEWVVTSNKNQRGTTYYRDVTAIARAS